MQNNPLHRHVTIDHDRINVLPVNGYLPVDTINFEDEINVDNISGDRGPLDSDMLHETYSEDTDISSFLPELSPQPRESDRIKETLSPSDSQVNELELDGEPLNEFTSLSCIPVSVPRYKR